MTLSSKPAGFTLLELLVGLAVLLIVTTVGVPAIKAMMQANEISTRTNLLVSSMHEARSRAIMANRTYTLCAADKAEGSDVAAGKVDWSEGWYLVPEDDCDEAPERMESGRESLKLTSNVAAISFRGDGGAVVASTMLDTCDEGPDAIFAGCFELVNAGFRREVHITQAGGIRSCRSAAGEDQCQ